MTESPFVDPKPDMEASVIAAEPGEQAVQVSLLTEPLAPEEAELFRRVEDPYILGGEADRMRLVAQARLFGLYVKWNARRLIGPMRKRILDVGCGEGQFSRVFAQLYPSAQVIGIDKNEAAIAAARAASKDFKNVEFVVGDIQDGLPDGHFDLVYGSMVFLYLTRPTDTLKRIYDSLEPGGALWIKDINPDVGNSIPHPLYGEMQNLFLDTLRKIGAFPDVSVRLPTLLADHKFTRVLTVQERYPVGNTNADSRILLSLSLTSIYNARERISKTLGIPVEQIEQKYKEACDLFFRENGPSGRMVLPNFIAFKPTAVSAAE